ncbi:hypothetical protein Xen7305DRAFT_00015590 [Xenococcus sp. PCC 7305]|uniref:hypothetical protein n=1 Tax=Xenococcus sp. PCC 7305 TaxID=102125 RepID=UPI0002ACAE01|nr:hypothetical protein [Xenococcus sp. PCC 7305]ELS01852.1 hypothetical protein Xen7305DRAFT_00015590 [Xenococcus sp. PCC 7305]
MKFLSPIVALLAVGNLLTMTVKADANIANPENTIGQSSCSTIPEFAADKISKNTISLKNFPFAEQISVSLENSRILAKFSPQDNRGQKISLKSLAATLGYKNFNWVNYVEKDPHGIANNKGDKLVTPYNDPPFGGYQYDGADNFPFYWDIESCENCRSRHNYQHHQVKNQFELIFEDMPSDYRLKDQESIDFITHLVGVKSYNQAQKKAEWEVLTTFRWKLTNLASGKGQVSLVSFDINPHNLPPSLMSQMQIDGGMIRSEFQVARNTNYNPLGSPQCPRQNHQSQHLDSLF